MPHPPTILDIRLTNIVACLTPAFTILNDLHDSCGTPFLPLISSIALASMALLQTVKRNKEDCVQIMEHVHGVLYAIVNLHLKSETGGHLSPVTLHHIGKFTETLGKIHAFLEAQQDGNKIKQFFRQGEMKTMLQNCRAGLQETLEVLKTNSEVEQWATMLTDIHDMQNRTQKIHKDVLELISSLSDGTLSDKSSSMIYENSNRSQLSSESFSMLPGQPKIFYGRDPELNNILHKLAQNSPRIAILSTAGIGKTSLAKAVLHHADTRVKYPQRYFIACDSATTSPEIAAIIGAQLGLIPGHDLTKLVVQHFSRGEPCLLILDNLETSWESTNSRGRVEEFLSLLTDIKHLALIHSDSQKLAQITMRGAERPAKVRWTRPFIAPLEPLSDSAARQTFNEITDDVHNSKDVDQILYLTGNMPLAVDLIAHLVNYEGTSTVLARWDLEKTSLLSDGYSRKSSLDLSIAISLSSPRMAAVPDAQALLSLLSILPDGLSDDHLLQSNLPVQDPLDCKATLIRTALAYSDDRKRLKSLVPIREHVQHFYPPSQSLFSPLCNHFQLLLDLYQRYNGTQLGGVVAQIHSNYNNIQQLLKAGLYEANPNLPEIIKCTIACNGFCRVNGYGRMALMNNIQPLLSFTRDNSLEARFITEILLDIHHSPVTDPELLITRAISLFSTFNDSLLEYSISSGMKFLDKGLSLSRSSGDTNQLCNALNWSALRKYPIGDYRGAQNLADEAQRLAKSTANLYEEARALDIKALCFLELGDYSRTISFCNRARGLLEHCGMSGGSVDHAAMNHEAEAHTRKSEYAEARAIHTHILQITSAEQDVFTYAHGLINIAEIDVILDADRDGVQQNLDRAEGMWSTVGYPTGVIFCKMISADLHLREKEFAAAQDLFLHCVDSSRGKVDQVVSYCLERLADERRWRRTTLGCQSTWPVIYLSHAQKSQQSLALHTALYFLGDMFLSNADEGTAWNLYIVALDGFTHIDVHRSRANCMLRLGDIARNIGESGWATQFWREARPLFQRSLQAKEIAQIDTRLTSLEYMMDQDLCRRVLKLGPV
ncbi:hypothetical protein DFH09DRAFT_1084408 [Mycena vulgaris]|nr:hypothetical protein DFH09DRAFT_1084408 [Mycena vulgaris]